jgi:hypothetical protein
MQCIIRIISSGTALTLPQLSLLHYPITSVPPTNSHSCAFSSSSGLTRIWDSSPFTYNPFCLELLESSSSLGRMTDLARTSNAPGYDGLVVQVASLLCQPIIITLP